MDNGLIAEALAFCLRCRGKVVVTAATITEEKLRVVYGCGSCKRRYVVEERAALKRDLPYKMKQPTIIPPPPSEQPMPDGEGEG